MLCDQVREHLSAYLDKELTADLSAAVRAHLDTCAECRALADDLRATMNLLGRLPAHAAPGHLADDVMREIERRGILAVGSPVEPQPQDRTLPMRRARLWPRALAVAATLVLAVGIGIFAYMSNIGRQTSPAPESAVVRKAPDASKASEDFLVATGPKPAAPADGYGLRQLGPADKMIDRLNIDADSRTAAADKKAWADKAVPPSFKESKGEASPGYSLAARGADAEAKEPAHAVALAKAGAGTLALGGANTYTGGTTIQLEGTAVQATTPYAGIQVDTGFQAAQKMPAAPSVTDTPESKAALGFQAEAPAAKARGLDRGEQATLEKAMTAAAEGEGGVEQLSIAATGDALRTADNQLVLRVDSPDEADRNLVELFKDAGWHVLAVDRQHAALKDQEVAVNGRRSRDDQAVAQAEQLDMKKLAPGGVYYRATRNGENVWLVLADRDSISRFGSRLAQAQGLAVADGSSAEFLPIRGLQDQLRNSEYAKANQPVRRYSGEKRSGDDTLAMKSKVPMPAMKPDAGVVGNFGVAADGGKQMEGVAAGEPAAPPPWRLMREKSGQTVAPAAAAPVPATLAATAAPALTPAPSQTQQQKYDQAAQRPPDRILLVIRVQPVLADRAEVRQAAPAATQPAEKPAP